MFYHHNYHTEPYLTSIIIYSPNPYAPLEPLCPIVTVQLQKIDTKIAESDDPKEYIRKYNRLNNSYNKLQYNLQV